MSINPLGHSSPSYRGDSLAPKGESLFSIKHATKNLQKHIEEPEFLKECVGDPDKFQLNPKEVKKSLEEWKAQVDKKIAEGQQIIDMFQKAMEAASPEERKSLEKSIQQVQTVLKVYEDAASDIQKAYDNLDYQSFMRAHEALKNK